MQLKMNTLPTAAELDAMSQQEAKAALLDALLDRNNLAYHIREITGVNAAHRQMEVRETIAIGARLGNTPFADIGKSATATA